MSNIRVSLVCLTEDVGRAVIGANVCPCLGSCATSRANLPLSSRPNSRPPHVKKLLLISLNPKLPPTPTQTHTHFTPKIFTPSPVPPLPGATKVLTYNWISTISSGAAACCTPHTLPV